MIPKYVIILQESCSNQPSASVIDDVLSEYLKSYETKLRHSVKTSEITA